MPDLAIIIVSYNSARWLRPCLTSVHAHAGALDLEVVVVDSGSSDGSAELVEREFSWARVLRCPNRGFAYANNRGAESTRAPFVLYLNPDTEIVDGSFGTLVALMRMRPSVGLIGCRQLTPDGALYPTIRRFPSAARLFFEALGCERLPFAASRLGHRVLEPRRYARETPCDWATGSFMLARREAVQAAGSMDERFFLYCEEPDLCLRIRREGWDVRYVPAMTIVHHAGKNGYDARLNAQEAYAFRQYFSKHLSPWRRVLAIAALALGHGLRSIGPSPDPTLARERRASARAALRTLLGLSPPPFGQRN